MERYEADKEEAKKAAQADRKALNQAAQFIAWPDPYREGNLYQHSGLRVASSPFIPNCLCRPPKGVIARQERMVLTYISFCKLSGGKDATQIQIARGEHAHFSRPHPLHTHLLVVNILILLAPRICSAVDAAMLLPREQ